MEIKFSIKLDNKSYQAYSPGMMKIEYCIQLYKAYHLLRRINGVIQYYTYFFTIKQILS